MPIALRSGRLAAGLAVLCLGAMTALGSCGSPGSPTSPPPPVNVIVRIQLIAPPSIPPGTSVQLTAQGHKSDGSVEDITSKVSWRSNNTGILQVTAGGLATGVKPGETTVHIMLGRQGSTAAIFVLPNGTFRLRGTVKNSGFGVAGVNVSVTSGIGAGLNTVSNELGAYTIYGVGGPVSILFRKNEYLDTTRQLTLTAHEILDLDLQPAGQIRNYSGNYTLTLIANPVCPAAPGKALFPDSLKRRTYSASVVQEGARLTFTLGEADFIVTNGYGNRFVGFVDGTDLITAKIGDAYYYYYYYGHLDIVERIPGGVFMALGTLEARGSSQAFSGDWSGSMMMSGKTVAPFLPESTNCYSNSHGFLMVRR